MEPITFMEPLVSIIINNYNYSCFVRTAIESSLAQTYKNIEVIIVDDGSTDDSRNIINEYLNRAKVVLKTNGGQASALNVGIAKSKGNFILILDSDDYLYPEAVEVCVKAFPNGYSRIYYRFKYIDKDNNPIKWKKRIDNFQNFDGDVISALVKKDIFPVTPTSCNFFDARKLKMIIPIPENEYRICADLYLLAKTPLFGPVRSIDRILAAYRIHGNNNFCSINKTFDVRSLENQIYNIYKSTELIEETCNKAGYEYRYRIEERNFGVLATLCTGYKIRLNNPLIMKLTKIALFRKAIKYLHLGKSSIPIRLYKNRTIYLYFAYYISS